MTRKKIIKLVAVIAVFAMVLPLVLVSLNAVTDPMSISAWSNMDVYYEEEIAPTDPNVTPNSFIVGETVYDPELTSTTALPEGWLVGPTSINPYYNSGVSVDNGSTRIIGITIRPLRESIA